MSYPLSSHSLLNINFKFMNVSLMEKPEVTKSAQKQLMNRSFSVISGFTIVLS